MKLIDRIAIFLRMMRGESLEYAREAVKTRRHAKTMASIRAHMRFFGCPIDELTDEEIEAGLALMGKAMVSASVSMKDASESLSHVLRVLSGCTDKEDVGFGSCGCQRVFYADPRKGKGRNNHGESKTD